jgi:prepilin-type N-terminal cleavage/methylation domain-containing protein
MRIKNKNLKGYSLLEMLVTLVVFAVLMTMIIQVLLVSIDAGRKISARSKVRGDLSELAVMIRRDFRNAGKIDKDICGDNVSYTTPSPHLQQVVNSSPACFFTLSGVNYAWVYGGNSTLCPETKMCKLRLNPDGRYELYYQSSDILEFDQATTHFELSVSLENENVTQGLVLASLTANASGNLKDIVSTQYRQVTVFTRNF